MIGLVGVTLGSIVVVGCLVDANRLVGRIHGTPYADVFNRLDNPLDIMFARGDGQASVALARDPSLSNLKPYQGNKDQAAFRAQRPLQGYLGWIFSAGQGHWAEEGVLIATLIGCFVAAAGCGELLRRRGRSPWLGLLVLALPGSLAAIRQFGPEMLGLGLCCFGICFVEDRKVWPAIALFALAGLSRETYLIVPLIYVIGDRRFLLPPAAWVGWTGVVWIRYGAFGPAANLGTRLLVPPFVGLAQALPYLQFRLLSGLLMATIPVLVFACVRERRADPLTRIVVLYAVFSILMNKYVWVWWASFSRPLLPLMAFALIALAGRRTTRESPVDSLDLSLRSDRRR